MCHYLQRLRPKTPADQRRGAAMIEFAFISLLFLAVFIGIVEFGRGVWAYTTVAHAARQAVRFAMVRGTVAPASDTQIRNVVEQNAVGLKGSDLTVTPQWLPDRARGSVVQVRVQYPFRFIAAPLLGAQAQIQLASTARMVVSQ